MKSLLLLLSLFLMTSASVLAENKDTLLQRGIALYNNGDYEKSIEVLNKALDMAKSDNDKKTQRVIYNNLGNNYSNIGKTVDALEAYQHSITLAEETGDKRSVARTTKNIGALYSDAKDFDKALQKYNEAEAIAEFIHDTSTIADCANNKGVVFEQQLKYNEALVQYQKAIILYEQLKQEDRICLLYNNLGIVYKYLKDYDKSIAYYERSLEISRKMENKFMVAANLVNIGNVYEMKGDYKKAIELNEQGLQTGREINSSELIIECYNNLAEEYAKAGDLQKGFDLYKKYVSVKDSFMNIDRSKQLAEIQTKYETEKKEKKIVSLEKTRYQMLAIIGIMVLLAIVTFLLYNRQQIKQKQAREKAILAAEYNERLRIAKDVHDDLGSGLSKISMMADIAQKRAASNIKLGKDIRNIADLSKKVNAQLNSSSNQLAEIEQGISEISSTAQMAEQEAISNASMSNDIRQIATVSKELIDNMRDLIWVLNPENTTLDNLVARLREYCSDYLEGLDINVTLDFPNNIPDMRISRESQRNIFSTIKESINNCVKHSGEDAIHITLKLDNGQFSITVSDNGKGFDMNNLKGSGNGLRNMRQRIEAIGGSYSIISSNNAGTTINLSISLEKLDQQVKNTTIV